ncbi:MAG: hypothetical protein KC466_04950, partial [Myxococcales bacterium]|nr:hypothetical protein [Myxococcales bacterium]
MKRSPARAYDRRLHWRAFVEELSLNVRAAPWVWPLAVLVTALCTWGGLKLGGAGLAIAIAP